MPLDRRWPLATPRSVHHERVGEEVSRPPFPVSQGSLGTDMARLLRFLDHAIRMSVMRPLVVVFHEEEEPLCMGGGKEVARRDGHGGTRTLPRSVQGNT
jgi:hypothetical protein